MVLATIEHLGDTIYRLTMADGAGKEQTLGVTAPHRFFSETRHEWVQTHDLRLGEELRGLDRPLTVTSLSQQTAVERVYNL